MNLNLFNVLIFLEQNVSDNELFCVKKEVKNLSISKSTTPNRLNSKIMLKKNIILQELNNSSSVKSFFQVIEENIKRDEYAAMEANVATPKNTDTKIFKATPNEVFLNTENVYGTHATDERSNFAKVSSALTSVELSENQNFSNDRTAFLTPLRKSNEDQMLGNFTSSILKKVNSPLTNSGQRANRHVHFDANDLNELELSGNQKFLKTKIVFFLFYIIYNFNFL